MIRLTRFNQSEFVLNAELIKFIETTPDTIITLTPNNEKFLVKETVEEVVRRVLSYRRSLRVFPED